MPEKQQKKEVRIAACEANYAGYEINGVKAGLAAYAACNAAYAAANAVDAANRDAANRAVEAACDAVFFNTGDKVARQKEKEIINIIRKRIPWEIWEQCGESLKAPTLR